MDVNWRNARAHVTASWGELGIWHEHECLVWLRATRIAWARWAWMQWIDEGGA